MLHKDCLTSFPGTFHSIQLQVFWGSFSHDQFMFGCCLMSHLSWLSERTPWAQGHEVYLSLCLWVPPPASSVFIKSVTLLTCLHSPSSPTHFSLKSLHTLTWFQRSTQRGTGEYVFEHFFPPQRQLCPLCLCQNDTVVRLITLKWARYLLCIAQFVSWAFLHIWDISRMLSCNRNLRIAQ